jgi:hypothetical protein
MSFGIKGIMAVGTDQFHLFAKAIMGTTINGKLGNVNFRSLPREIRVPIEMRGIIIFFLLISTFGIWILVVFFRNLESIRC